MGEECGAWVVGQRDGLGVGDRDLSLRKGSRDIMDGGRQGTEGWT